jgi:hypothetical protein
VNIFVLDANSRKSAQMLCDAHLRKMCTETAQILSGVMLRKKLRLTSGMPKPQNTNHPVIIAAGANSSTLDWVLNYNYDLHIEYQRRFNKNHAFFSWMMEYIDALWNCSEGECKDLYVCVKDTDVAGLDIVSAYRKYYLEVKKPQLIEKNMWNFTNREDWTNGEKSC